MSYGSECWATKKVDTRQMQAAKVRMMCGKTLRIGISNGLLIIWETRMRWLGHLERMDETNLVKIVREEKVPRHMKRGRPKNHGMR